MSETLQNDFLAAWIYATQAEFRDWSLPCAPKWRFHYHTEKTLPYLYTALNEIEKSVVKSSDPDIWDAPSPWHAALYCHMLQHHLSARGTRLLFRGHRCSTWTLTPSIMRKGVDCKQELLRTSFTSKLLSAISFNTAYVVAPQTSLYLRMSSNAYVAASQHYGVKTHLLDFTTDPDVAAWFATSGGDSDDGFACIHIVKLEEIRGSGLKILLPPPFINRLYLQRGVFIDTRNAPEEIKPIKIRFPWQPSLSAVTLGGFEVLRERGQKIDILPSEAGLGSVLTLADKIIAGEVLADTQDQIDALARTLKPALSEVVSDPFNTWVHYVDVFEDMLFALAYSIDHDNRLALDTNLLAEIIRDNVETCCSIAALYRTMPALYPEYRSGVPADKIAFQTRMADMIDGIAGREVGYVHIQEAKRYARHMGLPEPKDWTV